VTGSTGCAREPLLGRAGASAPPRTALARSYGDVETVDRALRRHADALVRFIEPGARQAVPLAAERDGDRILDTTGAQASGVGARGQAR
jgi:hypothetical protein